MRDVRGDAGSCHTKGLLGCSERDKWCGEIANQGEEWSFEIERKILGWIRLDIESAIQPLCN